MHKIIRNANETNKMYKNTNKIDFFFYAARSPSLG